MTTKTTVPVCVIPKDWKIACTAKTAKTTPDASKPINCNQFRKDTPRLPLNPKLERLITKARAPVDGP